MDYLSHASNMFKPIIYDSTLTSILSTFDTNSNNNNSDHINSELYKISDWLKLNIPSLNVKKSKYMVFHTPQKHVNNPKLRIDGVDIEQVKEFNFLGIILKEHLNWKNYVEYLSCKI